MGITAPELIPGRLFLYDRLHDRKDQTNTMTEMQQTDAGERNSPRPKRPFRPRPTHGAVLVGATLLLGPVFSAHALPSRPLLGRAHALRPVAPGTDVVSSTADDGSPGTLRSVLAAAQPGDTVTFASSAFGVITLNGNPLTISQDVTIQGPGADRLHISGNRACRVFVILSGHVAISGMEIENGSGGLDDGGGLYNNGALTLTGCTVDNSSAHYGGGLKNDGTLILNRCTFYYNSATQGGGLFNAGTANLTNCTFFGDTTGTGGSGGGIGNAGTLSVTSGTFESNGSLADANGSASGGGISNSNTLAVTASLFAADTGGDIVSHGGTITSGGSNLLNDGDGNGFINGTNHDQTGVSSANAKVYGLYIGRYATCSIAPDSPAVDADYSSSTATDGRNDPRPFGARNDIGAYEYGARPALTSVAVSPASPSVAAGLTQQFTATGTYADGSTADITTQVLWASDTPAVATISSAGLATGVAVGTAQITATMGAVVSTSDALAVTATVLNSLTVDPASASVPAGLTQQLSVTGHYSNGDRPVADATFTADASGNATVDAHGLVTGVHASATPVVITVAEGGQTTTAQITVAPAVVQSISASPTSMTLPQGWSQQIAVTGRFSDGTTQTITDAAFVSDTPAVATVTPAGLVTAVADSGTATITATEGGQTATAVITATAPALAANDYQALWVNADGRFSVWDVALGGGFTPHDFDALAGDAAQSLVTTQDGHAHVLLTAQDGSITLSDSVVTTLLRQHNAGTQAHYGPFTGWTAQALAAGPDGKVRVLWTNADGRMSLWSLNADGTYAHAEYGPFAGWTAQSFSVAPDNTVRVLWTNTSGQMSFWVMDAQGGYQDSEYGPYPGWTPSALATGPDGVSHITWNHAGDGQVSVWSLTDAGQFTFADFGPYTDWTAGSLAVGADDTLHIGWSEPDGTGSLWDVPVAAPSSFTDVVYGPYGGWSLRGVSAAP